MLVRDSERALLAKAEHDRRCDEARHDRTNQRMFEKTFESRDLPDSRAAVADASDAGWQSRMIARSIDAERRRKLREERLMSACSRLPRRPKLYRKLLWAIYRNGRDRHTTMAELHIRKSAYWGGLKFLLNWPFDQ